MPLTLMREYCADFARYIPGTLELAFQGMLDNIKTMEQVGHPFYKDLETFDFNLILDKNLYTNLNSLHFVFTIKFKEKNKYKRRHCSRFNSCKQFFCALDKINKHYPV